MVCCAYLFYGVHNTLNLVCYAHHFWCGKHTLYSVLLHCILPGARFYEVCFRARKWQLWSSPKVAIFGNFWTGDHSIYGNFKILPVLTKPWSSQVTKCDNPSLYLRMCLRLWDLIWDLIGLDSYLTDIQIQEFFQI